MNKFFFKVLLLAILILSLKSLDLKAQKDSLSGENVFELSVDELMNLNKDKSSKVQIVSASKKAESLFESPLSASVLTKEEIIQAGCTSIMEAMRLVPGVIVREQTNGNYDIHLRGLDNIPPNSVWTLSLNTTTLVMIDNRPVYNYYSGGTLWETLPIDIHDVERIEVIRGASAALYGPNAVTGVINIITQKKDGPGSHVRANTQIGTQKTRIANAAVGYNVGNFSFITSANIQKRNRHQNDYYSHFNNAYTPLSQVLNSRMQAFKPLDFPDSTLAMDKIGLNTFMDFRFSEESSLRLSAGLEESTVQKTFSDNNETALSGAHSETQYVDLRASLNDFTAQLSYLKGKQAVGNGILLEFNTLDVFADYVIQIQDKLSLTPAINFRRAFYKDDQGKTQIFNQDIELTTLAASLRLDYNLNDNIRLIGGFRADKFNVPNDTYLSYQLLGTYKITEKNMLRILQSRASRSSIVGDLYTQQDLSPSRISATAFIQSVVRGNTDIKLLTSNLTELGYRFQPNSGIQLDLEIFRSVNKNFIDGISIASPAPIPNPALGGVVIQLPIEVQNSKIIATQYGTTLSAAMTFKKASFKPFFTYLTTNLKNYTPYLNTADAFPLAYPNAATNNIDVVEDRKHKATPSVFGGLYVNYRINPKFNLNLNSYFYTAQTFFHRANDTYKDGIRGIFDIKSKVLLNFKFTYSPVKNLSFFANFRNLLQNDAVEFAANDRISGMFLAGMNFEL